MSTLKKTCPKCARTFPATLTHFYARRQKADGLHSACKLCINQQRMARFPVKEKTCIICGKLWKCTPGSDGRYRETCSKACLKTHRSQVYKAQRAKGAYDPTHRPELHQERTLRSLHEPTYHDYEDINSSFDPFS